MAALSQDVSFRSGRANVRCAEKAPFIEALTEKDDRQPLARGNGKSRLSYIQSGGIETNYHTICYSKDIFSEVIGFGAR